MHMSDALVSPAVGLTMAAVSAAAVGLAVSGVKKDEISEKKVPVIGVAGAMVFAAQMINFAIPATGSSGHIGGGVLLAGLLGGFPAFLSVTAVLVIQCLFFADGGILALGCNVFNLGVIPCLLIYPLIFKPVLKRGVSNKNLSIASVAASVTALALGAFCVVLMTVISGISQLPFGIFTSLMIPVHIVIGLVEGVVTAAVLCFIFKMRPEIIESAQTGKRTDGIPLKKVIVTLLALTVLSAGALTLFASTKPDGLEWAIAKTAERSSEQPVSQMIAGEKDDPKAGGGISSAAANVQERTAILPDYAFANDTVKTTGTQTAGIIGAAVTFILAGAAGLVISRLKKSRKAVSDG